MPDLLSEIDDAMRHERMEKLWKEHKKSIFLALGLIILATALGSAWKSWDYSVRAEGTAKLMAMLESPAFPGNVEAGDLGLRPGLRGVAMIQAAAAYLQAGKKPEALALYDKVINDGGVPDDIRGMAVLMRVRLLSEEQAYEPLLKSLKPLLNNKKSPWYVHAQIEAAGLYAHGAKDYARARDHLALVTGMPNLPPGIYAQAQALDHVYAMRQAEAEKQTGKETEKTDQNS